MSAKHLPVPISPLHTKVHSMKYPSGAKKVSEGLVLCDSTSFYIGKSCFKGARVQNPDKHRPCTLF